MRITTPPIVFLLLLVLLAIGCVEQKSGDTKRTATKNVTLSESFVTDTTRAENIDSPAYWTDGKTIHWVIATAKATDRLMVYDAGTGAFLKHVGTKGNAPRQFRYPNGVAVVDDFLIIVERDNHRVQLFHLPEFTPLGFIGADELRRPYGVAVFRGNGFFYTLYVTDNYGTDGESVPPDSLLGERVKQYSFTVAAGRLQSKFVRAFGEVTGGGVLRDVESIYVDPENNTLLIAEEDARIRNVKVYTLDGNFTGKTIGDGVIEHEAEGIALYRCNDTEGYWVLTDQSMSANRFHLYGRTTFTYLGSFAGKVTLNTDGIWLVQQPVGSFEQGVFYAVHNDQAVAAFSWQSIADSLSLRHDCGR